MYDNDIAGSGRWKVCLTSRNERGTLISIMLRVSAFCISHDECAIHLQQQQGYPSVDNAALVTGCRDLVWLSALGCVCAAFIHPPMFTPSHSCTHIWLKISTFRLTKCHVYFTTGVLIAATLSIYRCKALREGWEEKRAIKLWQLRCNDQ